MTHAFAVSPTRLVKRLRPQISPWLIVRQRLLDHLNDAANFPVTHISAPAGYGKTTLLSHWVSQRAVPTPWLTFDAADNTIDQVVTILIGAIQQVEPLAGNQTLSILNTGGIATPVLLAASLVDEIATLAQPVTIVLDDFHVLDDAETITFIESLFRRLPPNLHLVIGSRHAPPFPTATLRGYGQLVEIDTATMAFTADEATTFLRAAAGRPLHDHELAPMVDAADGLPAALQVCALALRHPTRAHDSSLVLASMTEDFLSFLKQEVLDRLPVELQQHLVRLAVPERLAAGLAQALVTDLESPAIADWTLPAIARSGLFLSLLGAEGDWYQFHSLFREALLARQRELIDPATIAMLHEKASDWFLDHGDIDTALRHSVRSNEPGRAAGIVAAHAQQAIAADGWIEAGNWISLLDHESRNTNLEVLVAEAMYLQARARYDDLAVVIGRIREHLAARDNLPIAARRIYEADLAPLEPWTSTEEGQVDRHAMELKDAYMVLDGTNRFSELFAILIIASFAGMRDPATTRAFLNDILRETRSRSDAFARLKIGWVECALAHLDWHEGNLPGIAEHARQSLVIARQCGTGRLEAQDHVFLGLAQYEHNDLADAERSLREATRNPKCGAIFQTVAHSRLAMCLNAMGRDDECDAVVEAYRDRLLETGLIDNGEILATSIARIAYARGNVSTALAQLDAITFTPAQIDSRAIDIPWLLKAIILYQRGEAADIQEADRLLDAVLDAIDDFHVYRFHLQAGIARAFRTHRHGDNTTARALLHEALRSAERRGFARTFLDLGETCRYLLVTLGDGSAYAAMLLDELARPRMVRHPAPDASETVDAQEIHTLDTSPLLEPLTMREIDVLTGLQQRLSNKEIAWNLAISPLTVKTHTRNLYAKLGVNNRRQAIARAKALGIPG